MKHVPLNTQAFGFPMPVVLVGTHVEGKPNFMTVAWVSRVNMNPPLIAVALGENHLTPQAIRQNGEFSISVPGESLVVATDHVGLVSGHQTSKAEVFDVFYGTLANAPMVAEAPVTLECRLVQHVSLPQNGIYIGEIVGAYAKPEVVDGNKVNLAKSKPMLLSMPDNRYWGLGEVVGKAWSDGRGFKP